MRVDCPVGLPPLPSLHTDLSVYRISSPCLHDHLGLVVSTQKSFSVAMLDGEITSVIVFTSISGVLILFRCCYRLLSICKIHTICHRTWHSDDAWMAFAILPLAGRCACIVESFIFDHNAADLEGQKLGRKLQIPARIFYALLCVSHPVSPYS
jgi:hypothetical protein